MGILKDINKVIKIRKFNLFAGKRKIVNPTPYGALILAKQRGIQEEITNLEEAVRKYRKWKKMKLRDYSKGWRTRIKNERAKFLKIAQEHLEIEEFRQKFGNPNHAYIDMYEEMGSIDCRSDGGSVCYTKWPSYVDYYFSGDETEAYKNFDYYKEFHNIKDKYKE